MNTRYEPKYQSEEICRHQVLLALLSHQEFRYQARMAINSSPMPER